MAKPLLFRQALEDSVLAPPMTPELWESFGDMARRHPVIMGVLAYILETARNDEAAMAYIPVYSEEGKAQISNLQGQHAAKRWVVGHICDLMGDLALSGAALDQELESGEEMTPNWARPDDEEETSRRKSRPKKAGYQRSVKPTPSKGARKKVRRR